MPFHPAEKTDSTPTATSSATPTKDCRIFKSSVSFDGSNSRSTFCNDKDNLCFDKFVEEEGFVDVSLDNGLARCSISDSICSMTDTSSSSLGYDDRSYTRDLNVATVTSNSGTFYCNSSKCVTVLFDPHADVEMKHRWEDFTTARQFRERRTPAFPYGVWGLFQHLACIHLDLEWAEDVAYRRQRSLQYVSWIDFNKVQTLVEPVPKLIYTWMFVCTWMLFSSFKQNDWKMEQPHLNPMLGASSSALLELGALSTSRIVEHGEWWRLLAPIVLHAGLIHYFINMLALWFIGCGVERAFGSLTTFIVVVSTGVFGNLATAIFSPYSLSVGASGSIFGLIGLCLADVYVNWGMIAFAESVNGNANSFKVTRVLAWLCLEIVVNVLVGLTPHVNNFAHIGGLFYGFCLGSILTKRIFNDGFFGLPPKKDFVSSWVRRVILFSIGSGLFIGFICILSEYDVLGSEPLCPACKYISCVPIGKGKNAWWKCDDCDSATGTLHKFQNYSVLELDCPFRANVNVLMVNTHPDTSKLNAMLPNLCRQHCLN